ncbi:IMPACT family member YigZ [wastewater metagenome]|uniref:IMPACT family member YigZ n=2 Tax=unclassified sequences TaxID=12908 RepID=A0A5B8R9N0_9ZZZZ|nr:MULTISPECIES: YigZ family protein [Arhodomonas]MCS4504581.1 YigZ family protein [Arhodomonas aquaeolei]QEA05460.1 IMPACT family member YigZ [uncultured organism]
MADTAPLVPAGPARAETLVRKSRFIAHAERAETRGEAFAVVDRLTAEFPDARHHCWAYLVGDPEGAASAAVSDAGEPSGTAGRPILGVIQHKGIADVVVVVVRYFGGIKLGAGGLTRAYAGATEQVLSALELTRHRPCSRVRLHMGFAVEQPLRHWASGHDAWPCSVDYGEGVVMELVLPDDELEALSAFCGAQGVRMEAPATVPGTDGEGRG